MGLDIRWPLGVMFGLIGLLLAGYGLVSDPASYQRSLGININLWWGLALLAFGAVMVFLARLSRRRVVTRQLTTCNRVPDSRKLADAPGARSSWICCVP
jgi:hypothetical protein